MNLDIFKNKKIQSVLILLGLSFYCIVLIFVFGDYNKIKTVYPDNTRADYARVLQDMQYVPVESFKEVEEVQPETVESIQPESDVLGVSSSGARCENTPFGMKEPQLFCAAENLSPSQTYNVGESGTIEVSENATIKFVEIYAPSALFTGSKAPLDNLLQTSNEEGRVALRSTNEMINPTFDYLAKTPPIDNYAIDGMDRTDGTTPSDKEPFMMYGTPTGSIDDDESVQEIVLDVDVQGDQSFCPDVVNDGRFNVDKSNQMAWDLVNDVTPPGLMDFQQEDYVRENDEFCQQVDPKKVIHLERKDSFLLCKRSAWESALQLVGNIVTLNNVLDEAGKLLGITKTVTVDGILIDAPLGSADSCHNETCAIRYMEAGRLLSSPPTETSSLVPSFLTEADDLNADYVVSDPIFLTTPCKINVDGRDYNTKCYWDLSAWQHQFKLEENFVYPGFKGKFDEDQYWDAVKRELTGLFSFGRRDDGEPGGTLTEFNEEDWANHLSMEVQASGLMSLNPSDASHFFPGGTPTVEGWVKILTAMSYLESGHRPDLQYDEGPYIMDQSTDTWALSTGLFQMSQGGIRGYRFPGYENITDEELKDPYTNITIAVQLLERLVNNGNGQVQCISCKDSEGRWRGGAAYWAVLRDGRGVDKIKNAVK